MKNLKRLTKKSLKSINGGAGICPSMSDTCDQWCGWTPWQKSHCLLNEACMPC
ncbi:bacteriocin-like protein [Chryseobacterium lactis]|uniref:bacteriocin-like protein n=1 Tax=Chryseobacterium lactis TaxID=1241981 RepID=UPI0038B2BBF5